MILSDGSFIIVFRDSIAIGTVCYPSSGTRNCSSVVEIAMGYPQHHRVYRFLLMYE